MEKSGGITQMFRGLCAVNIDDKGRVAIPKRHRELLAENGSDQVVVTIDTESPCLLLYPTPIWQAIELKLSALPSIHPATKRIQRLLIGHATDLVIDKQGRILVPPLLREYAHLEKCIMWVGQGNKIELWGQSEWEQNRQNWLNESLGELPSELQALAW